MVEESPKQADSHTVLTYNLSCNVVTANVFAKSYQQTLSAETEKHLATRWSRVSIYLTNLSPILSTCSCILISTNSRKISGSLTFYHLMLIRWHQLIAAFVKETKRKVCLLMLETGLMRAAKTLNYTVYVPKPKHELKAAKTSAEL